jgi:hypothetical protein
MFELSNDYVFSISKILTDVASKDTLLARRFFYTALAAYNPWDKNAVNGIEKSISWVIANDDDYRDMDKDDLERNREIITIAGIERYFNINQKECCFNVCYKSFVDVWFEDTTPRNAYSNITRAADTAVSMTYGRTNERFVNGKERKVHEAMPVFKKITIDGMNSVKIELNSSFMPYLVLLTELFGVGYSKFPIRFLSGKKSIASLIMTVFVLRYFVAGGGDEQIFRFDVKTLRRILGCENKYPVFRELKRSIIDKGIKEIEKSEDNGFKIEIVPSNRDRHGNQTTHITFKIVSEELNTKQILTDEQRNVINNKKQEKEGAFDKAISFKKAKNSKSKSLGRDNNPDLERIKRMTNNT